MTKDANTATTHIENHHTNQVARRRDKEMTATQLRCSECGAMAEAACDCGKAYEPPGVIAAKAIEAYPQKSDRRIARECGIGLGTVQRARQSADPNESPERRLGKDGKSYLAKRRIGVEEPKPEKSPPSNVLLTELKSIAVEINDAIQRGEVTVDAEFENKVRPVRDIIETWLALFQ
jgi:hypothetical protein